MSYLIKTADISQMGEAFMDYVLKLETATSEAQTKIDDLICSVDVTGQTAESIQLYYAEVHPFLLSSFVAAFKYLETSFCVNYSDNYLGSSYDIAENDQGELPQTSITSASKKLSCFVNDDIAPIDAQIAQAIQMVEEAQCSVTTPSSATLVKGLSENHQALDNLDKNIELAEASGLAAFKEDETYSSLLKSLGQALATCARDGYATGYRPGTFFSDDCVRQMAQTLSIYQNYVVEHQEEVAAIETTMLENNQTIVQREYEEAASKKTFWECVGTAASILGTVLGGVALVSAGPVGLLVGGAMLGFSICDSSERLANTFAVVSGNAESDRTTMAKDAKSKLFPLGGVAAKGAAKEYDNFHDGDMTNQFEAHRSVAGSAGGFIGGKMVDAATDQVVGRISGDGEFGDMIGDVAGEMTSESLDQLIVQEFDGTGTASSTCKVVTIVADYYGGQADEKLDECNARTESINELKEAANNRTQCNYDFALLAG